MSGVEDLPVRRVIVWGARPPGAGEQVNNPVSVTDEEIERVPNVRWCYICGAGLVLLGIAYRDPMWVFECDGGRHRHLVGPRSFGGQR